MPIKEKELYNGFVTALCHLLELIKVLKILISTCNQSLIEELLHDNNEVGLVNKFVHIEIMCEYFSKVLLVSNELSEQDSLKG